MGFMDKAKKMAEQAQQKLDEVQEQFNQGQGTGQQQQQTQEQAQAVRYDEHGRPIEEGPPAGETPPPAAQPAAPEGSAEANPDPFKPIE